MTVETATTIDDLNASYPSATDPKSEGDDHIRLIKTVVKANALRNVNPSYTGTLTGGTGVVNIGAGQFYKDANGNVAIGNTVPNNYAGYKTLTINGTNGGELDFSDGGLTRAQLYSEATAFTIATSGSLPIKFSPGGTEKAQLTTSGSFGLGGTPSYKFDLYNSGGSAAQRISGNDQSNVRLRFENTGSGGRTWELVGGLHAANNSYFSLYDATGGATAWTVDSSGNLLVGTTSAFAGSRLRLKSSGTSNATYNIAAENSAATGLFTVRDDGYFCTGVAAASPYNATTASAANLFVNAADGGLYRSTSSIKYKKDVEDLDDAFADRILDLRPVWYRSKCETDNSRFSYYGFIAEEAADVDPRFVHWKFPTKTVEIEPATPAVEAVLDDEGNEVSPAVEAKPAVTTEVNDYSGTPEAEGFQYERIVVPLLSIVKRQKASIEAMQTQLDEQNTAMQLLAARLAALEAK